ncbi:carboxymuconolactone decarboxylase [Campylobacter sp. MIT 12-8780]|nr:carboxymuconolactone decarboxylase [Campylobacter sp. MIT 19-121]TKX29875.1 carboxymuconolactone decarboxylase [Campylobacter sp. MIT 12-5580]TQR41680.1 carboxymuconolactone decarboxylase [Campylobacter sp. MIT 12-8780]
MNLTQLAKQNFEKLFGKETPELAKTDPEFFSAYINFAFDEVQAHTKLSQKEQLMLILGALIASGGLSEYKIILKASLKQGISPAEIKEILYQSTPYVGIGKALEFILATNELFKAENIAMPLAAASTTTRENRAQKGLEIQRKFFGEAIDKGNAAAPAEVKHIRTFLSAHCFGDFYTRKGLELKFRELLTFVFVTALGGADAQVKAHIAGNLNIGNDKSVLIATITALIPYIGYPRSLNALALIEI